MTLLTAEEKELLMRAANLKDELLEVLEVMQDNEIVEDLKAALREVEEGKTRPSNELIRELNLERKFEARFTPRFLKRIKAFDRDVQVRILREVNILKISPYVLTPKSRTIS